MWTRRELIEAGLAACLVGAVPARARAAQTAGPRYVVNLFLRGGVDAIYTTDPRAPGEVEPRVDLPYDANAILDGGGLPMGPHLEALRPWGRRLTFVRGVSVSTANHESGARQMLRMRTGVSHTMPALMDIIGRTRDTQCLGGVSLGQLIRHEHSEAGFAAPTGRGRGTLLHRLDALDPADLDALAKAFRGHVAEVEGWAPSASRRSTLDHLRQVAALFERLPSVPRFAPERWSDDASTQALAVDLQRVLWLVEHDLARGIFVKIYRDWDTHFRNAARQGEPTRAFSAMFARFLDGLERRRNAHGALLDQTLVVTGSELGRFPVLNGNLGKDHLPETHLTFVGAGLPGGRALGATDRMMVARPVSSKTGRAEAGGAMLSLDDVGATLLHMAGLDPSVYGYRGRRLAFLYGGA